MSEDQAKPSYPKFEPLIVPVELALDHRKRGGIGLRRKVAFLESMEVIRVMAGIEPCGPRGEMILHVSVSVARSADAGEYPSRRVTDAEFRAAIDAMQPDGTWYEDKSGTLIRHAFFG